MSDGTNAGYLESHPIYFSTIKEIGIPARTWDEVLKADFDLPHPHSTPLCFDWIVIGWRDRDWLITIDFDRPDGLSNHDYARLLLQRSRDLIHDKFDDADPNIPGEDNDVTAAMIELDEKN